jgi:hypothetical protein
VVRHKNRFHHFIIGFKVFATFPFSSFQMSTMPIDQVSPSQSQSQSQVGSTATPSDILNTSENSKAGSQVLLDQFEMRKKIVAIQSDNSLSSGQKAKMIQDLMSGGWLNRQQASKQSRVPSLLGNKALDYNTVTEADLIVTYNNQKLGILGCKHYQRATKLQGKCCGRWFTCRFCHDEASDHNIVR